MSTKSSNIFILISHPDGSSKPDSSVTLLVNVQQQDSLSDTRNEIWPTKSPIGRIVNIARWLFSFF